MESAGSRWAADRWRECFLPTMMIQMMMFEDEDSGGLDEFENMQNLGGAAPPHLDTPDNSCTESSCFKIVLTHLNLH